MQIMDRMTDTVIFVTVSLKSHEHTRTHLFNGPLPRWKDLGTYHLILPNNTMDYADTTENIPARTSPG